MNEPRIRIGLIGSGSMASAMALGWAPRYDFRSVLDALKSGADPRSPLALAIGAKGYHDEPTGVYTS